ncbi:MAG: hypothetical protein JWN72_2023, partial [Thermoleophilia bacterium]|nr:hypothetical protein [Thermoleophilia bacterium]
MTTNAPEDAGAHVAAAPFDDVAGLRRRHAGAFVVWARPLVLAVMALVIAATALGRPSLLQPVDFAALGTAIAVAFVGHALLTRVDRIRVANWTIGADAIILATWVASSPHPEETTTMLLWPVIALAYFGSPRWSLVLATLTAAAALLGSQLLDTWDSNQLVPPAAYVLLCSGVFVSFVTRQGRRIEAVLVAGRMRDRRVLAMSRRIHLSEEPTEAITELAQEVGIGLDVDATAVALLDPDCPGAISAVAAWRRTGAVPELAPAEVAEVLRDALHPHHAAIHDTSGSRLVAIDPGRIEPAGVAPHLTSGGEAFAAVGELFGCSGCLLLPLTLRDEEIAVLIVAGPAALHWEDDVLPLLQPLAPQLAAGLAQVMLVRDQRAALQQLEGVGRMRDRLIANVSHELRTPLTSTLGFIETLLRPDVEFDDATRAELMEHARAGGHRLLALVEDLLALGSIRPESLVLAPTPIGARGLIEEAIVGIEVPDGRELRGDVLGVHEPELIVDRNRMLQVVSNLVMNAVQHGAGSIDVVCDADGGSAVIEVLDDGDGVEPAHVNELFLPFARFSTRTDSTGLG